MTAIWGPFSPAIETTEKFCNKTIGVYDLGTCDLSGGLLWTTADNETEYFNFMRRFPSGTSAKNIIHYFDFNMTNGT